MAPPEAQQDEAMNKLIHDNADAVRQMARLEEDLRQAKAEAERAAKERAEAERAAAEGAKKAAEEAKAEAVASAIAAFIAEGWRGEGHKDWMASVVEVSVYGWVKGLGAMWLAHKGEDYCVGESSSHRPSSTEGWPTT
ncbi:unnamed protein product [Cuscuta europaea]|uniref:Uncharacterized protein n=1 Tax=Cuscuta europaea TaxID=41803 RepID=A0A9P1EBT8_CUSEU|nr:unnamed protein product [Cuscuta europaea]